MLFKLKLCWKWANLLQITNLQLILYQNNSFNNLSIVTTTTTTTTHYQSPSQCMVLMRKCGVELEKGSMQSLLRFMVYTQHNPQMLVKLLQRMRSDRSVRITYIECVALTLAVNRRMQAPQRMLKMTSPVYEHPNYLSMLPETLSKVSERIVGRMVPSNVAYLRSYSFYLLCSSANAHHPVNCHQLPLTTTSHCTTTTTGIRPGAAPGRYGGVWGGVC